jgi:sphingosine kinase
LAYPGSANGLCVNLLGPEDTFNIPLACLNVIKGKAMPLDLCAVTRGEELRWSFMSVAAGLMCDVDLGM